FFSCKPKPTIENISSSNKEITKVSQPEDVFVFGVSTPVVAIPEGSYISESRYGLTSCELLRDNDLKYISPRELRLIRNEIYARYGYQFKDSVLQTYFEKQDWYKPLYDNVEEYITPLERANIKFILKKEKTNPEISDEEQFQIFLETYKNYGHHSPEAPRMLLYKFFISGNCFIGGSHFYSGELPPTKNYAYLIYSIYGLCDHCTYSHSIYQFNKKGELLNDFYLGESDDYSPFVEKKSNNRYEIWFTYYTGERGYIVGEENYEELMEECEAAPVDTIRIQFHYDNDGQIVLAN
ncbi:MAG: YARHG domain-containing protein, partial [Dysgonamonadaceae bacterium]|nr:YARHG domain-containing protein [Dysgonamonadaceae bacterium]